MDTPVTTFSESPDDPFAVRRSASALLDDTGRVVGWSERAEALLGYSPEEVLGRAARDLLLDPRDEDVVMAAVAACVSAGGWFGVIPVRDRGGQRVELGCRARAVVRSGTSVEWHLVSAPAEQVIQWETDRSVLDGMFRRSPIGLAVLAPDLSLLRVNRAIARFGGLPAERYRGRRIGDFVVDRDTAMVESGLRRVLETGEPLIFTEQPCHLRHDPHTEMFVSVSAFRMQDSSGRILGVTELVEDVTDRYQARRRLALLNDAGARIGTTLDVEATARELAEVAVPDLADCASVDLLEAVTRGEEPGHVERVARGEEPGHVETAARGEESGQEPSAALCRAAVRSVSPEAPTVMFPVGHTMHFPPEAPQARCLAERRPVLEPVLGFSPAWSSLEPERVERIRELGVHSLIAVPLVARGLVLGVVSLWRWRRPEPFEEDDLTLAEEFAARAAVCIDNARRFTQQQQAAVALQRSLLPREVPEHHAVEVARRYRPADTTAGVGGDWFDVIPLSGLRVALVVGDVVGRGIHAAATMGRLRTAVHTLAHLDLPPDEVLSHLDDLVDRLAAEQEATDERSPQIVGPSPQIVGATCLYAVYDPVSGRCALARAGHPPPAVVTPDGRVDFPDLPAGPPLGLGGLPFETAEVELPEGSLLVLYTDGLLAAWRRDLDEGLALLRGALSDPARSLDDLCEAVEDALLPESPSDDIALLAARTRCLAEHQVATWELPSEPTAAAEARKLVAAQLHDWGLEEMALTTELIVSELITNAYRYSSGSATLRLIRDHHLICEVSDTSSTSPHLRHAATTDEGGRGLFLVAQLTARWGTRYVRNGKTIWAEQAWEPGVGGAGGG
ncbi:SpoIIE family protein phosphatase [Streptomyces sp. NPDC059649]|uniref:SpoIIE family protein phosphatase n=1 Tax=Streptomyces sp. NPDC059649 TaxID=3346895 RepID=UPI0036BBBF70